jgi:hypothetical protein
MTGIFMFSSELSGKGQFAGVIAAGQLEIRGFDA